MTMTALTLDHWLPRHPLHPKPVVSVQPDGLVRAQFHCMASPCEILLAGLDQPISDFLPIIARAIAEAWRIEQKYSRYQKDNTWMQLHACRGKTQAIDDETLRLIQFADQAFQLSEGLFDITSGVLRKHWRFDGKTPFPSQSSIESILPHIGWEKVEWHTDAQTVHIPKGMELDFGGIGKEYAVERAMAQLLAGVTGCETYRLLVNLGGDIAVRCGQQAPKPWRIAIEQADTDGGEHSHITLANGAVATSGDTKRHIKYQGKRYGHILNPKTGYPVVDAPLSVTVLGHDCIQAGMLATFTQLQGPNALDYIRATGVPFVLQTATGSFRSE